MALEDLAMIRAIANTTVLYPSDPVSAERAVELVSNVKGIRYIRTSRYKNKSFLFLIKIDLKHQLYTITMRSFRLENLKLFCTLNQIS
jgi:transketolase C-terminal domain/subunit